jgi:uncharacterized protein (TIGR02246 family)
MRTILKLSVASLALAAMCLAVAAEQAIPKKADKTGSQTAKGPDKAAAKPADKAGAKPADKNADKAAANAAAPENNSAKNAADEEAIRATAETFAKAYVARDAKAIAAHFTPDAEYVDEHGNVFEGRQAIEDALTAFFAENSGYQLDVDIDTIRFLSPGVAIEDGTTTLTHPEGAATDYSHYTTVHVKTAGKWLAASVREHAPKDRREHRAQLQQLEWLVGDWVDEDDDSIVEFTCQAVDNGNFLLRQFSVKIAGEEAMSGTQRIGWDPISGKLRAWIFDSEGGYAEGTWHRNEESWVLKSTGVTADGQTASGTSIYTFVSDDIMTWQAIDHEIAGVQLPDSEVVTIVRKPPHPELSDSTPAKN